MNGFRVEPGIGAKCQQRWLVGQQVIHDAGQKVRIGCQPGKLLGRGSGEIQEVFQPFAIGREESQHLQGNGLGIVRYIEKFFNHFRCQLTTWAIRLT